MIPLRISLKNFITYRDEQTLLFDKASLWVLTGRNGAGKSSVFDAITFALYGCHRAGNNRNAESLINHKEDSLAVEFDFLLDGITYRVRRTVSKRGRSTRQAFRLIPAHGNGSSNSAEPIPDTENEEGFKRWRKSTIGLEYDTFTSSVLLLQGQSEKLLNADPRERYKVLEELVNLSPYKKLHKLAEKHRKDYEVQVKALKEQLQSVSPVSDEQLNEAREALVQTEEKWISAQEKAERLTKVLEQAKQWEYWTGELARQKSQLDRLRQLLNRENEIEAGLTRFQELIQVLHLLKSIVNNRERLVEYEQQIEQLQQESQQLQVESVEVEKGQKDTEEKLKQLEGEINELQEDNLDLVKRQAELAPVIEKLSQLEKLEADLSEIEKKLAKLPSNLAESVQQAEERERQLAEAKEALLWLRQLTQSRLALAEALKGEQATLESLESVNTRLQEYRDRREQLNVESEAAREAENKLSHDVTRAQHEYDEACNRRNLFEEAASQPTCEFCGQPITPEHVKKEKVRLDERIALALANLNKLKSKHQKAKKHLSGILVELKAQEQQLASLEQERNQSDNALVQFQRDAKYNVAQVNNAFNNLPAAYQVQVTPYVPRDTAGWIDTTYPTDTDLKVLSQEVDGREAHAKSLKKLRKQLKDWQDLDVLRRAANEQLEHLEANVPLELAQQARSEQNELHKRQQDLQSKIEQKKKERNHAKQKADNSRQNVEKLRRKQQQNQTDLKGKQAAKIEINCTLQSTLESLPEKWQQRAATVEANELEEWEIERGRLAEYENLSSELKAARQSVGNLEQQINSLTTEIDKLPQEARRPANKVEQELDCAKTQRTQADSQRLAATGHLNALEQQLKRRMQLEQEQRDAERKHKLYKLLSELLGPEHLQLHLLRRAERSIVELANETLDGLSRGQLRLELPGGDDESGTQSKKALDLVAYNYETGPYPTAVSITSGSQRFRIAVSLALAIGRYAGQEARRIESVIIDEGFGGLDKNGRDDMIQELNELQQQLARIVLVSHQEEFAGAFANGYAIELVDGASRVSLLENA